MWINGDERLPCVPAGYHGNEHESVLSKRNPFICFENETSLVHGVSSLDERECQASVGLDVPVQSSKPFSLYLIVCSCFSIDWRLNQLQHMSPTSQRKSCPWCTIYNSQPPSQRYQTYCYNYTTCRPPGRKTLHQQTPDQIPRA